MTDQPAQEPTMEEILASIRRIISEDDAPVEAAPEAEVEAEATPEPAPEPVAAAAPEPAPVEEDVLELTETYDAVAEGTIGDLEVSYADDSPDPFPTSPLSESYPEAVPAPAPAPASSYDTLVGDSAAASAASAFAGLASAARRPSEDAPAVAGPTIDELARSLLRPMLKEWLDAHLPGIVEAEVRKEVERIARNAG